MITRLYAVRDRMTGFLPVFSSFSDDTAVRDFGYTIKNSDVMQLSHADYDLYFVGQYDTESGLLIQDAPPSKIADGGAFHA